MSFLINLTQNTIRPEILSIKNEHPPGIHCKDINSKRKLVS
jgi:hypothetical protein